MKKKVVVGIVALIVVAIVTIGVILILGREKDVKPNNKKHTINIFDKEDITKITIKMGNHIRYSYGKYKLDGDYTILGILDSQQELQEFIECFDNWDSAGSHIGAFNQDLLYQRVWFQIDGGQVITCELTESGVEGKGKGYLGSIGNVDYLMPEEFGEYVNRIYDEKIGSATKLSDSEFAIVDESRFEFVDFTEFGEGYRKIDANNNYYGVVDLASDVEQGADFDHLLDAIEMQDEGCMINNFAYYAFESINNIYNVPVDYILEVFNSGRVICYYSNNKLVGVVYFRLVFNQGDYKSLLSFYEAQAKKYCEEHNKEFYGLSDFDLRDESVFTEYPVINEDTMKVEVYYYDLDKLHKYEYATSAYEYRNNGVSSFYFTNEHVTAEDCDRFTPKSRVDSICVMRGKVYEY